MAGGDDRITLEDYEDLQELGESIEPEDLEDMQALGIGVDDEVSEIVSGTGIYEGMPDPSELPPEPGPKMGGVPEWEPGVKPDPELELAPAEPVVARLPKEPGPPGAIELPPEFSRYPPEVARTLMRQGIKHPPPLMFPEAPTLPPGYEDLTEPAFMRDLPEETQKDLRELEAGFRRGTMYKSADEAARRTSKIMFDLSRHNRQLIGKVAEKPEGEVITDEAGNEVYQLPALEVFKEWAAQTVGPHTEIMGVAGAARLARGITGMSGSPSEHEDLDKFLAKSWLTYPAMRKEGGLYHAIGRHDFSEAALREATDEHMGALERMGKSLEKIMPSAFWVESASKALGDARADPVLAATLAEGYDFPGVRLADNLPGVVDAMATVMTGVRPAIITKSGGVVHPESTDTQQDLIERREKAKAFLAFGIEVFADPVGYLVGFGATGRTAAAVSQVSRSVKHGEVIADLGRAARKAKAERRGLRNVDKAREKKGDRYINAADEADADLWDFAEKQFGDPEKDETWAMLYEVIPDSTHPLHAEANELLDASTQAEGFKNLAIEHWEEISALRTQKAQTAKEATERGASLKEEIVGEARTILAENTLHEARPLLKELLDSKAGPGAGTYFDEVIGASLGQQGLVLTVPFGKKTVELVPRHKFRRAKEAGQNVSWLMRRKIAQYGDRMFSSRLRGKVMGDDLASSMYRASVMRVREAIGKALIPGYRQSLAREWDAAADWAATRVLDEAFGGPPIEATGHVTKPMKQMQEEIADLHREKRRLEDALGTGEIPASKAGSIRGSLTSPEPGTVRAKIEEIDKHVATIEGQLESAADRLGGQQYASLRQQQAREALKPLLANAMGLPSGRLRRAALATFAKRSRREIGDAQWDAIEPALVDLMAGKWPDSLAKKGIEDVRKGVGGKRLRDEDFQMLVNRHQAGLDGIARTLERAGPELLEVMPGEAARIKVGEIMGTKGVDDFLRAVDDVDPKLREHFDDEDLVKMGHMMRMLTKEFEVMHAEALANGVQIAERADYFPGIYERMDLVVGEWSPSDMTGAVRAGSGPNPLLHQTLAMPQSTALGINPQRDALKVLLSAQAAHRQRMANTQLMHTAMAKFGREVKDAGEAVRGVETMVKWTKKKGDKFVEQRYALPKHIQQGLEEAVSDMSNPDSLFLRGFRRSNTFFRNILTSPNPGFHVANLLSNQYMMWQGGVRNLPLRTFQGTLIDMLPHSDAEWLKVQAWVDTLKGERKGLAQRAMAKQREQLDAIANWKLKTKDGREITYRELADQLREAGVVNKGWSSVDLRKGVEAELRFAMKGPLGKAAGYAGVGEASTALGGMAAASARAGHPIRAAGLGAAAAVTSPAGMATVVGGALAGPGGAAVGAGVGQLLSQDSFVMRFGRWGGEKIENVSRTGLAIDQIAEGASFMEAAAHTDRYMLNYRALTSADKTMRDVQLFWSWMRKNMELQATEALRRPGRIKGALHIKRAAEGYATKDWEGIQRDYEQRWAAEKYGLMMPLGDNDKPNTRIRKTLILDRVLPWTDLAHVQDHHFMETFLQGTTPIAEMAINALYAAQGKPLQILGRDYPVNPRYRPAPGWIQSLPTRVKKRMGVEMRFDKYTGTDREFINDQTMYWVNKAFPGFRMLSTWTSEDATKSEQAAAAGSAYIRGWRMYPYDEVREWEGRTFELERAAKLQKMEHLKTGRSQRDPEIAKRTRRRQEKREAQPVDVRRQALEHLGGVR